MGYCSNAFVHASLHSAPVSFLIFFTSFLYTRGELVFFISGSGRVKLYPLTLYTNFFTFSITAGSFCFNPFTYSNTSVASRLVSTGVASWKVSMSCRPAPLRQVPPAGVVEVAEQIVIYTTKGGTRNFILFTCLEENKTGRNTFLNHFPQLRVIPARTSKVNIN